MSLEVNLTLCLPTDELSVPVVRHICSYALTEVGVREQCLSDISLALTEACTNVLDHVQEGGEAYEVIISIDDKRCAIRVKDAGKGFDFESRNPLPRWGRTSGRPARRSPRSEVGRHPCDVADHAELDGHRTLPA